MKPIDRRFRLHSTLIAGAAVSVAVTLVAPVVAEASQQGIPISVIALLNAGVLMLGIAYLLWSSAWTLPVVMNGVTVGLERGKVPRPLVRGLVLAMSPALLATSMVYGVCGGGVREFRRVQRVARGRMA